MDSAILAIIGAGEAALPIIEKAHEMGIIILAFARQQSYAQNLVDIFVEENDFDVDFMQRKCLEYNVAGVMATSELTTEVAARLAASLHLPGNSIAGGFAGKNKFEMRKRVANVSTIKQPRFELYKENVNYAFPVVVKAVDSCGKKGISLVRRPEDLQDAVDYASKCSSDGRVLVEEYLEGGCEYSIECLSDRNGHYIIQYTEKETSGPPHFTEIAHHQPAILSNQVKETINIAVSDVLDVLGLCCGMAHLELKIIGDDIFFIEVGARGGGDHIADILTPHSTDCDYFKAAIECALDIYHHKDVHTVACTGIYFHCKQNESRNILFVESAKSDWCLVHNLNTNLYADVSTNVDASNSGYIIYCSDHRIQ